MAGKRILGLHRNVFYSGLVSLFMDVSTEMVYPLVPLFLTGVLGTTKTTVGVIEGIAESTASILKVFSGWISDRLGRRKSLMILGYGVSAISRPIIAAASTWEQVLTARFIDRFGKGVRTSPRDAIIAESTEKHELGRAFGFHRAMDTIGATIGPAFAFLLLLLFTGNLRLVFFLSTVPALVAVLIIILFIKETAVPAQKAGARSDPPAGEKALLRGPLIHYIAVIALFSLGNVTDAFIILRARDLGVAGTMIPVIYLLFNLTYALSSAPLGIIADRVGIRNTVHAGLLLYGLVFSGFALAETPVHAWMLFILYGACKGISEGTQRAYLALLAPETRKATAFGLYHTATGLMLLPASIIGGVLWDSYGPGATFGYAGALAFLAAVVFGFRRRGLEKNV